MMTEPMLWCHYCDIGAKGMVRCDRCGGKTKEARPEWIIKPADNP